MKRTIYTGCLLLTITLLASNLANAQLKRFSLGPYIEAGFPTGDLSDTHNTGIGAGLSADIKLVGGLGVTGSIGYMRFGGKTVNSVEYNALQAIPVRAGLKYKFPFPLLYVKLEGGAANFTGKYSGSSFIVSPGIGIRVLGLDVQAKYEAWVRSEYDSPSFFGLKAGYNF